MLTLKFPVSIFPFSLKPIYETGILWLNQESMCQWLPLATTGYHGLPLAGAPSGKDVLQPQTEFVTTSRTNLIG